MQALHVVVGTLIRRLGHPSSSALTVANVCVEDSGPHPVPTSRWSESLRPPPSIGKMRTERSPDEVREPRKLHARNGCPDFLRYRNHPVLPVPGFRTGINQDIECLLIQHVHTGRLRKGPCSDHPQVGDQPRWRQPV